MAKKKAKIPPDFICPITQDIMTDPYSTVDGQTYEHEAILAWFRADRRRSGARSPVTNLPLPSKTLTPNYALKNAIEYFIEHQMPELNKSIDQRHRLEDLEACIQEREDNYSRAAAKSQRDLDRQRVAYQRSKDRINALERQLAAVNEVAGGGVGQTPPLPPPPPSFPIAGNLKELLLTLRGSMGRQDMNWSKKTPMTEFHRVTVDADGEKLECIDFSFCEVRVDLYDLRPLLGPVLRVLVLDGNQELEGQGREGGDSHLRRASSPVGCRCPSPHVAHWCERAAALDVGLVFFC